MPPLPFVKMQGLGNDFLVVDLRHGEPQPSPDDPIAARKLCDRRFGVGADGVLAVLPSARAAARMRVWNADGSEAEMCGNGLRCVARYLAEEAPSLRSVPRLEIETGAGVLECCLSWAGSEVEMVEIGMGPPRFARGALPMAGPEGEEALRVPIAVEGRRFEVTGVSMGNPHAVIFLPEGPDEPLRGLAGLYGPVLEEHPLFPRRTNVEFARLRGGDAVDLVVWERGCGITLACGTGACATAAAACRLGLVPEGRTLRVELPGGALEVTVAAGFRDVRMRGPAVTVFRGGVDLARLLAA